MDDELLAFLRSMADDPDDTIAPLVFADWLEERNDTRAHYIRLAHEWLLADRAAAHDLSTESLTRCYRAMNLAKAAFLPLLTSYLRPYRQEKLNVTTAHGFAEGLIANPEELTRIPDPSLFRYVNLLDIAYWPSARVPDHFFGLSFPLLHTVTISPSNWIQGPYDSAAVFRELIRWLDRPAMTLIRTIQIQIPTGPGWGGMLAWLEGFEYPLDWSSKTIRVLPPIHYYEPRLSGGLPIEEYEGFAASPIGNLLTRENVESLDPRRLVISTHPIANRPTVEARDFFRIHGLSGSWCSPAERSPATAQSVERAVGKRPPSSYPPESYDDDGPDRPRDPKSKRRGDHRRRT